VISRHLLLLAFLLSLGSPSMPTTDALDSKSSTAHPRYDEYEESRVDWLGEIPAHWEIVPFRYYCDIPKGKVDPKSEEHQDRTLIGPNHVEQDTGNIRELETAADQGASSDKYLVEPGDLIYSKIRPELNKVCIAEGRWLCSADMYPIKIRKGYNTRFLKYLMLSRQFVRLMVNDSMRVAMPKVNRDTLEAARVLLPPLDEQRAIAAYLDRETERIDALIEKKEQLIDLLEEKRKSLISRVVTKGLDDDVEMQDSGVEWLGEIPAHWDLIRLKYTSDIIAGDSPPASSYNDEEDGVPLVNGPDEYSGKDYGRTREIRWTTEPTKMAPKDSLLFCVRGATTGRLNIAHSDLCVGRGVAAIVADGVQDYLNYQLMVYRPYALGIADGTTYPSVTTSLLGRSVVAMPPEDEQHEIAEYLHRQMKAFDTLIGNIEEGIERLKEYRTALISAAVTGQIDVRGERETDGVKKVDTWARMNLVMELIRRMRTARHQSFGRTMLVKMLYLIQHHVRVKGLQFNYKRKDFGPYPSELRYEVENTLQDQGWLNVSERGEQVQYDLREKADDETVQDYFERSWGDVKDQIDEIVSLFHRFENADQAEIVATLYAAWNDLLILDRPHSEDDIIHEVRHNWHPRKQKIPEDRWRRALRWMKENRLVPTGFGDPTFTESSE